MMRHGMGALGRPTEKAADRSKTAIRLLKETAAFKLPLAIALVLIAISAAAQAAGPWLIGRIIDQDILGRNLGGLGRDVLVLGLVYVIGTLCQAGQTLRIGEVTQRLLASLRNRIFAHIERLPLEFFHRQSLGDLMSRVLNDVDTLNQFFSMGITQLLGALMSLAGIIIAMLSLNARMALVSMTILPVMILQTLLFSRAARKAYRETRKTTGEVTSDLQEEIVGVREAQAFNRTEQNIANFRQRNAANRNANIQAVGVTAAFSPAIDILSTLATTLVIGFGSYLVMRGELSVGLVAAFLVYVQQFFRPIQLAAAVYTQMQSALAGAERIFAILDEAPEAPDRPDAAELEGCRGAIAFEGVSFAYEKERPVLEGIDFTVEPGQMVALVGETGAGKTTIAQLIPRFYETTAGRILLDGKEVKSLKRANLRDQIALVPQEPFLFSSSIAENIAYGRPGATREEIQAAAQAVGAHAFISALPQGYDTPLGEGASTISQGQRQLLSIARAILADRPILIMDEATSHVDTRTEKALQEALAKLLAHRTSIVIAHRLSTIRQADVILVIKDGRIAEKGTHAELLAQEGLYAELHRMQFVSTEDTMPA